jgi:ribA/ribD-fused uncharacterized protein
MYVNETSKRLRNIRTMPKHIFFWSANDDPYGVFSQWYPVSFEIDGKVYTCAEQYMMAEKCRLFLDKSTKNESVLMHIMDTDDPKIMKKLGRKVIGFDPKIWKTKREKIVYDGNLDKFMQNPKLEEILMSTKDKILVEASPYDRIWGIGFSEKNASKHKSEWGENLLGKALMDVREFIHLYS